MENKNLVHTEFVNGYDKSIYLDLKKANSGNNYLVITQSRRVDEENRERTKIILFEHEIAKFSEAMMRSLLRFNLVKKDKEKISKKYSKAFTRWTVEDEQQLAELYTQGCAVEDLTISLERNAAAITARLKKLGLMIAEETIATA